MGGEEASLEVLLGGKWGGATWLWVFFKREIGKEGTRREKRWYLSAFNLYLQGQFYHMLAKNIAGNCPQYWTGKRASVKWSERTAKR